MPTYAVLGTAHIHTPDFVKRLNARDAATVSHVWDPDPARAAKYAADLGGAKVASPEEICAAPEVDAVVICSPTRLHPELVTAVTAARKHLFVEKPLGMGAEDSARMQRQIEEAGVIFQTGYFMRGFAEYRFIKQQLEAGTLGDIYRVQAANCHKGSIVGLFDEEWRWMADPAEAGCGGFGDLGFHSLDLLIWMFGEIEGVSAVISGGTRRYGDTDESGEAIIRFKSGVIGSLSSGWTDYFFPQKFLVSGHNGTAALLHNGLYVNSPTLDSDGSAPFSDLPESLPHAFELYLDAVETGKQDLLVPVAQAAYGNRVIEAMYRSAREGREVKLD